MPRAPKLIASPHAHDLWSGDPDNLLHGFTATAFGARIAVRVEDAGLADILARNLPPGVRLTEAARVHDIVRMLRVDPLAQGSETLESLIDLFDSRLRFALAVHARTRIFIHAGVVGWRGHALLVPGRSFGGKSTLTAALLEAGATYFSDEHAVLDSAGNVYPWPRALALRTPDGRQVPTPAETFGATVARRRAPVRLVLVTQFRHNAVWRPKRIRRSAGAMFLIQNAPAARVRPEAVMTAVSALAEKSVFVRSNRPEAHAVARDIIAMLDRIASASGPSEE